VHTVNSSAQRIPVFSEVSGSIPPSQRLALRREPRAYLLPEYEDPSSEREVLEEFWPVLFEAMLVGWVTDEASWPKNRTFGMFQEWFDVQMSSIVEDLYLGEPLEYLE